MDLYLGVSATVIALPKIQGAFCNQIACQEPIMALVVCLFYFSEIETQNFRDDALLVQEICSFIHFIFNVNK